MASSIRRRESKKMAENIFNMSFEDLMKSAGVTAEPTQEAEVASQLTPTVTQEEAVEAVTDVTETPVPNTTEEYRVDMDVFGGAHVPTPAPTPTPAPEKPVEKPAEPAKESENKAKVFVPKEEKAEEKPAKKPRAKKAKEPAKEPAQEPVTDELLDKETIEQINTYVHTIVRNAVKRAMVDTLKEMADGLK